MTTVAQLALPIETPEYTPELTIAERFAIFCDRNPHVFEALESLAAQWLSTHRKVGVKFLFEVMRWQSGISTDDSEPWVLNNSFTSLYARELLAAHPEWVGRIETRALARERAA